MPNHARARVPIPHPCHLAVFAVLVLASGCAARRMERESWRPMVDHIATEAEAEQVDDQASGDAMPAGESFEARALRDPLQVDMQLDYAMERQHADGTVERWQLVVSGPNLPIPLNGPVTATSDSIEYRSGFHLGLVSVAGPDRRLEISQAGFALGFLQRGLVDACEVAHRAPDAEPAAVVPIDGDGSVTLDSSRQEALHLGWAALFAMGTIAHRSEVVRELMFEIVQRPSWWKLLVMPVSGIDLRLDPDFDGAERVTTRLGPGWRLPVELAINGDPAFYATVTCVEPTGALKLTAGVVAVAGFAPHRPEEHVRVQLTGARSSNQGRAGREDATQDVAARRDEAAGAVDDPTAEDPATTEADDRAAPKTDVEVILGKQVVIELERIELDRAAEGSAGDG